MIAVRRLLKSWATPPVSWPIASIFCDWRSSCSIRCRLVRSRMNPVNMRRPFAPRFADRQLDRKDASVLGHRLDKPAVADDPRLAGLQIVRRT